MSFLVALAFCVLAVGTPLAAPPAWADENENPTAAESAEEEAGAAAENEKAVTAKGAEGAGPQDGTGPSAGPQADASRGTIVEVEGESNLIDPAQRADNSFLYDTTIDSLFSQASLYENKIVQVSGEVIGDVVVEDPVRRNHCWITLTSTDAENSATISVLLSKDLASQIDHLGRYGITGTILQVRGVYHQGCSEHEGIPDIHASTASVLARGSEHPDLLELDKFIPGIVTVSIGLILLGVYVFIRERSR